MPIKRALRRNNMTKVMVHEDLEKIIFALKRFGQITVTQAMDYFDMEEVVVRANFKYAVKQKYAVASEENDAVILNSINSKKFNKKMDRAMTLLAEIMKNVEIDLNNVFPQVNEPFQLFVSVGEDIYDILYFEKNNDKMLSNIVNRTNSDGKFFVIVENPGQKETITFTNNNKALGYYLVDEEGVKTIE